MTGASSMLDEPGISLVRPDTQPYGIIAVKRSFDDCLQAASQVTPRTCLDISGTQGSIAEEVEHEKAMIRLKAQEAQSNPLLSQKIKDCMRLIASSLDEPDDLSEDDWHEIEKVIQDSPIRFSQS